MGSCCFTPRRTQFLWWYWLLLASIVGIPMFLACWYVHRHPPATDEQRAQLGRKASRIFWFATYASAVLVISVLWKLWSWGRVDRATAPINSAEPGVYSLWHLSILIAGYVGGLGIFTAGANRHRRWLWIYAILAGLLFFGGLLLLLIYPGTPAHLLVSTLSFIAAGVIFRWDKDSVVAVCLLFTPLASFVLLLTVYSGASLAELLWLIAVCLLPAHFCARFSVAPSRETARNALLMVIVGAFLFWAAAKYGRVANLYAYELTRGRLPDPDAVSEHMHNGF